MKGQIGDRTLKRTRRLIVVAGAIAIVSMVAAPAHANLITNGSFESGPAPGAFTTLLGGDTSITGWTVTGHSIDYIGSYWQSSDGTRNVDLNGNGQGGIQTSFPSLLGQQYRLSFDMSGNPDGPPTIKNINLTVGSLPTQPYTFNTTGISHGNMGWVTYTYYFTGTGLPTTIAFDSADGPPGDFYGAAIDNVDLTAVPEPGTLLLLGSGLSALALARRRR